MCKSPALQCANFPVKDHARSQSTSVSFRSMGNDVMDCNGIEGIREKCCNGFSCMAFVDVYGINDGYVWTVWIFMDV